MEDIKIFARTKEQGSTNSMLNNGKIPCVIYGKKIESKAAVIETKILHNLVKKTGFFSTIIAIDLEGNKEKVIPKEIQYHPVNNNIIHVDFMQVQDDTKVTVEVPVNFLNKDKCPGIKQGGVLNMVRRKIELVCSASQIPDILEYDLIKSEIGDSIKISSIVLPENVKPKITDRDFVVATLVPPTVEAEPEKTTEEAKEGEGEGEGEQKTESGDKKETKESPQAENKDKKTEAATNKKEDSK